MQRTAPWRGRFTNRRVWFSLSALSTLRWKSARRGTSRGSTRRPVQARSEDSRVLTCRMRPLPAQTS
uniref:Putative secreted protein n=1 Tax=Ixodes ricinus TaxID=34613 RepID=A0A6B0TSH7_IXORI